MKKPSDEKVKKTEGSLKESGKVKLPEDKEIFATESECVECRLLVRYDGWQGLNFVRKPKYYTMSTIIPLPLFIDVGRFQKKKVSYIALQARVKTKDEPCNCKATVDGKIMEARSDVNWSTWTITPESIEDAAAEIDPTDLPSNPYGWSWLLHKLVLKSFVAKIISFGRKTEKKKVALTCDNWTDICGIFDLGARPTIRAVVGDITENGKLIFHIAVQFENL